MERAAPPQERLCLVVCRAGLRPIVSQLNGSLSARLFDGSLLVCLLSSPLLKETPLCRLCLSFFQAQCVWRSSPPFDTCLFYSTFHILPCYIITFTEVCMVQYDRSCQKAVGYKTTWLWQGTGAIQSNHRHNTCFFFFLSLFVFLLHHWSIFSVLAKFRQFSI